MKIKIIVLTIFILLLCGCNNKKCIKSHKGKSNCVMYTYTYSGKVMVPVPHYYECYVNICDEWSDK